MWEYNIKMVIRIDRVKAMDVVQSVTVMNMSM